MTKRDRNKKIVQKPLSCTIFVIESKAPEKQKYLFGKIILKGNVNLRLPFVNFVGG